MCGWQGGERKSTDGRHLEQHAGMTVETPPCLCKHIGTSLLGSRPKDNSEGLRAVAKSRAGRMDLRSPQSFALRYSNLDLSPLVAG